MVVYTCNTLQLCRGRNRQILPAKLAQSVTHQFLAHMDTHTTTNHCHHHYQILTDLFLWKPFNALPESFCFLNMPHTLKPFSHLLLLPQQFFSNI